MAVKHGLVLIGWGVGVIFCIFIYLKVTSNPTVIEQQKYQLFSNITHKDYILRELLADKGYLITAWDISSFCGSITSACTSNVVYYHRDRPQDAHAHPPTLWNPHKDNTRRFGF
jgi:hypothetical protein